MSPQHLWGAEPSRMKRLKSLQGVLVRNLASADSAIHCAAHTGSSRDQAHEDFLGDGGCFFSLHPVESSSGRLSETSIYVSTLCKERCNPSWSDVEHEDMSKAWHQDWEHHRIGIRVWSGTRRSAREPGTEQTNSNTDHVSIPIPRVAPWDRGRRIWEGVEQAGGAENVAGEGGGVGISAQIPDWACSGEPFSISTGFYPTCDALNSGGMVCQKAKRAVKQGGLLGGGWVDTYRCGARDAAYRRQIHFVMCVEVVLAWADLA